MNPKELAKNAINHGYKAFPYSNVCMVWDQNGATCVTTLKQLKEWMGY